VVDTDRLYNCAAGHNTFHVTAAGLMQPCLMVTDIVYNVRDGDSGPDADGDAKVRNRRCPSASRAMSVR